MLEYVKGMYNPDLYMLSKLRIGLNHSHTHNYIPPAQLVTLVRLIKLINTSENPQLGLSNKALSPISHILASHACATSDETSR